MYLNESLFAQFISEKEITWGGIDFSKAKFTKNGFDLPQEILYHYFNEWNKLIISDQKKYDIRMAFRKPLMQYDLFAVTKRNNAVKLNNLLLEHLKIENQYTEEAIIQYAKNVNIPNYSDFSLLFIVESFDQNSKIAAIWVVIQQASTGEVALCEKFLKTPSGFGTRNFWARVFYNLLFDIKKSSFLRWVNMVQPNNLIK